MIQPVEVAPGRWMAMDVPDEDQEPRYGVMGPSGVGQWFETSEEAGRYARQMTRILGKACRVFENRGRIWEER